MEAAENGDAFDKGVGEEGVEEVPDEDEDDVSSLENSTSTAGGISVVSRLQWLLKTTFALRSVLARATEEQEAQPRVTLQS